MEQRSRLGPYEVRSRLGGGGMGEVYAARDGRLERDVAIKVVRYGLLLDEEARTRFRKEAHALARLNHPNVAAVYDVGEDAGIDYLVMEFVNGPSLAEKLRSGALRVAEALVIAIEIASALEEAHEQGVVHRDLKPGNVALTSKGHVKVLDFGLAKILEPVTEVTVSELPLTRGMIGTILYMSPEQVEGGPLDARTDLWSLGVILYECLVGSRPFDRPSTAAVLHAISTEPVKSGQSLRPEVPADVDRILERALQKDVEKRYQTAQEMKSHLTAALGRLNGAAVGGPTARGHRAVTIGTVLLAVVCLGVLGWLSWRSGKVRWAREKALPEIVNLRAQDKPLAAFLLSKQTKKYLPDEKLLSELDTTKLSIDSDPEGATVEIQDYLSPSGPWQKLGVTPLKDVLIPNGYFRWKLKHPRTGEWVSAPVTEPAMKFPLMEQARAPAGMVSEKGGEWEAFIGFVGWVGPVKLPSFYMDRYEVTNRDYQRFVDAGGYEKQGYWNEKFLVDGREIDWHQAMERFRDGTGRHGPATWRGDTTYRGKKLFPYQG